MAGHRDAIRYPLPAGTRSIALPRIPPPLCPLPLRFSLEEEAVARVQVRRGSACIHRKNSANRSEPPGALRSHRACGPRRTQCRMRTLRAPALLLAEETPEESGAPRVIPSELLFASLHVREPVDGCGLVVVFGPQNRGRERRLVWRIGE